MSNEQTLTLAEQVQSLPIAQQASVDFIVVSTTTAGQVELRAQMSESSKVIMLEAYLRLLSAMAEASKGAEDSQVH